jgi:hypothetical protein
LHAIIVCGKARTRKDFFILIKKSTRLKGARSY